MTPFKPFHAGKMVCGLVFTEIGARGKKLDQNKFEGFNRWGGGSKFPNDWHPTKVVCNFILYNKIIQMEVRNYHLLTLPVSWGKKKKEKIIPSIQKKLLEGFLYWASLDLTCEKNTCHFARVKSLPRNGDDKIHGSWSTEKLNIWLSSLRINSTN